MSVCQRLGLHLPMLNLRRTVGGWLRWECGLSRKLVVEGPDGRVRVVDG